jgi:hypothetical protein
MRARRIGGLVVLFLVGHGLAGGGAWAVEASAAPGAPRGGHEAAGGATSDDPGSHRIGDWTLVDGHRLVTGGGDGGLSIACGGGGNGVVVEMTLVGGVASAYDVRLASASAEHVVLAGRPTPDAGIAFDDDAEDRLLALLASQHELTVTLLPRAPGVDEVSFRLGTAAFAEAFGWLGCGVSDSCPVRSCGR